MQIELYDDAQLTTMLRHDDLKAFDILFHKYKTRLYQFAMSYLHESPDAEEIVQNTFLAVWNHRYSLESSGSIKSYLFKITVNAIYNHLKHKLINRKYEQYIREKYNDTDETTQNEIFYQDLHTRLISVIAQLPEQQQRIFRLSRIDGLSYDEIAEKLKISIRTIENQIYRATKIIKEKLGDDLFSLAIILHILFNHLNI